VLDSWQMALKPHARSLPARLNRRLKRVAEGAQVASAYFRSEGQGSCPLKVVFQVAEATVV